MNITIQGALGSQVANGGTFTVSYPAGHSRGSLFGGVEHGLSIMRERYTAPDGFTVTLGTSNITIANNSGTTWPAGSEYILTIDAPGVRDVRDENGKFPIARTTGVRTILVNLGSPIAADADGISASQDVDVSEDPNALLDGALAAGGRVVLDVPRNVVAAWTGTAVVTVKGEDEYGKAMVESSASGTSFTGKKAFKVVTEVSFSADVTAATVGTGDVLGLPMFLPNSAFVLKELQDGAAASAGTIVAGVTAVQTATTGDVRGTYDPNAAADGSRVFQLLVALADPTYRGARQYAG
jgi:hypothetical protein